MAIRVLTLAKGDERYVFRFEAGYEAEIIDAFCELANRRQSFDWIDAAMLAYHMGRRLELECDVPLRRE